MNLYSFILTVITGGSESPSARGTDNKYIASLHVSMAYMRNALHPTVAALNPILTGRSGLAATHAEGTDAPTIAQDGCAHGLQEADSPHSAITASPAPGTAGVRPYLIRLEAHRETKL